MADETVREVALAFAFQATDLLEEDVGYETLDAVVTDVLSAAERVAAWLAKPLVAKLVLMVGPVTEQT